MVNTSDGSSERIAGAIEIPKVWLCLWFLPCCEILSLTQQNSFVVKYSAVVNLGFLPLFDNY